MKLRNKKTGIIGHIEYVLRTTDPVTGEPLLTVRYKDNKGITCYNDYETIKDFNEEWEDYKPVEPSEPLIKDEKIRKAVRAWCEANNDTKLYYHRPTNEMCVNDDKGYVIRSIKFKFEFRKSIDLESGWYSINNLCGEEEE